MSGSLPVWLERWLGVEAAGPGQGTLWTIEYSWPLPPWATLLAVIAVIAWVAYFYAREQTTASRALRGLLVLFRLALVAILAFMIAEVTLSLKRTGLPTVAVLLDDSSSMAIADKYDDAKVQALVSQKLAGSAAQQLSRLNLAKGILLDGTDLLAAIEARYRLKLYFVSSAARGAPTELPALRQAVEELEPRGASSRLGAGLHYVLADLRGTPPAAVVVLSDGINTEGESLSEAARYARRKGVPLFTVGIGSDQAPRDLELSDLLVDEVVFVDDVVNFEFKLAASGLDGKLVNVTLRESSDSRVLAQLQTRVPNDGKPLRLRLPYRPTRVGEFEYVVEVEPLTDETSTLNNRQSRLVSVRKEQILVLLVQGYPNYEFRFLKNMLERDSTIQLKTVLQEADPEYASLDQSALGVFPVRRDDLFAFDVVIFGDVSPAFLSTSALANLRDFVDKKGGGIAFIAGPQYTPLAYRHTPLDVLFPIDLASVRQPAADAPLSDGFSPVPTELGLASAQMQLGDTPEESAKIWRDLPPLYWLLEVNESKPAARVLAEHPTRLAADGRPLPVFLMQYVGAGKVLFHATDETWRWRYRTGDVFFARYWVQAVRYLSRSKLLGKDRTVELAADRREYRRGDVVQLRARFVDEREAPSDDSGVAVMLEHEGQPNRRITLNRSATNRGVFEAVVNDAHDGKHHAWIAAPTLTGQAPSVDFLVVAPPGESERSQMDSAELKQAAEQTRGHYYRLPEVDRLIDDLPPGRQVPIETLPPEVLWNRWWMLAAFATIASGEWILRKRKGML